MRAELTELTELEVEVDYPVKARERKSACGKHSIVYLYLYVIIKLPNAS